MMRAAKFGSTILLCFVALWPWGAPHRLTSASADTASAHSIFYRLVSKYQYGAEVINFDIVVGCNVKITSYEDGDRSYDAFRDPVVFAKAASDGSALWQIVPDACQGETSANHKVPRDFLPGVIWFQGSKDFSLGVGYLSETAFSHPGSPLKFLGASILPATREEWEAFKPTALTNLVDSRRLVQISTPYSDNDVEAHKWDHEFLADSLPDISCHLVARFQLSEESARAILRRYWPPERPRYWAPNGTAFQAINTELGLFSNLVVDGRPITDFFVFGQYNSRGFPTSTRGGTLYSNHKSTQLPPSIFPVEADDGVPWMTKAMAGSAGIVRHVRAEPDREGQASCYSSMQGADPRIAEAHFPNYSGRNFAMEVNGEKVVRVAPDEGASSAGANVFFEGDEFLFLRQNFNLN